MGFILPRNYNFSFHKYRVIERSNYYNKMDTEVCQWIRLRNKLDTNVFYRKVDQVLTHVVP